MSAFHLRQKIIDELNKHRVHFIIVHIMNGKHYNRYVVGDLNHPDVIDVDTMVDLFQKMHDVPTKIAIARSPFEIDHQWIDVVS